MNVTRTVILAALIITVNKQSQTCQNSIIAQLL